VPPEAQPRPGAADPGAGTVGAGTPPVVLVAARNEADRIADTLAALRETFPGAQIVVADDASDDGTADEALRGGAELISRGRPHGKGANVSAAAYSVLRLAGEGREPVFLLCDGDLGRSASRLAPLVEAVRSGRCDLAVAAFSRRLGGGFGLALRFARWAIRRRCGVTTSAPISGQRALSAAAFRAVVPFAPGYGMEVGMTIDAVRAGYRLCEIELDLEHRATGRTVRGFAHRARQLLDFGRAYLARRRPRER
jgi:glycosyltransferase involved in cell wall biosynthesis